MAFPLPPQLLHVLTVFPVPLHEVHLPEPLQDRHLIVLDPPPMLSVVLEPDPLQVEQRCCPLHLMQAEDDSPDPWQDQQTSEMYSPLTYFEFGEDACLLLM